MAQTLNKLYSDIDFTFTRVPVTGDVAVSYDFQAVTRSVRNLFDAQNAYNVTISFFLQNATTPTSITILLERNR